MYSITFANICVCGTGCRPALVSPIDYEPRIIIPSPFPQSWDAFFRNAAAGAPPGHAYTSPPSLRPSTGPASQVLSNSDVIRDHLRVQALIRAYQIRGQNIGTGFTSFSGCLSSIAGNEVVTWNCWKCRGPLLILYLCTCWM